jgi:hypothetical protein
MKPWATRLRDDLEVSLQASTYLASSIAADVASLPASTQTELLGLSDTPGVSWQDRNEMLGNFQVFMELVTKAPQHPAVVGVSLVAQNYIAFVYLGEALFTKLKKASASGSTARRCATFLTDNPVRALRNATAHGNWRVRPDRTGLEFWARKGAGQDEPMHQFSVTEFELNFWQALARCTAYASYLAVDRTA